jgi:DNA-binding transcriptional LysR family regulator
MISAKRGDCDMKHYNILDISIYQIELFFAVANERNLSDVALKMNITQPALTKRIQSLEGVLGVTLFDRDKRPIELTEAGRYLAEQWRPLSKQFEISAGFARGMQEELSSRLMIGLLLSGKPLPVVQRAGKRLQQEHETVSFSWEYKPYGRWRSAIAEGEVDVMFVPRMEEPTFESDWAWTRVMEVAKLVCMLRSNPLSTREDIRYEDLRTQHFVVNSPKVMPIHYKFICQQMAKHGFEPTVARYSNDPNDLIGCLEHDDEVVVCDMYLRDSDSEHIKCFPLPDTFSGLDAVWLKNNANPHIHVYLDLLRDELEKTYPGSVCHDIP